MRNLELNNRDITSKWLVGIFLLLSLATSKAQVTIGLDRKPSPIALLDLKTIDNTTGGVTTKAGGLLLPRVALTTKNSLAPFIEGGGESLDKRVNKGLLVYNLTTDDVFQPGIYIWNGTIWAAYVQSIEQSVTNGLSLSNNSFTLGGELTKNTSITGSNTLTLSAPTTISNTLVINDGKPFKTGRVLKAMDNAGRAEWQDINSVTTTPPVSFGDGISYDPSNTLDKVTGTTIILPPGKWLVQCTFLFEVETVSDIPATAANQASNAFYSHWVQVRMHNPGGSQAGSSLVSGNISKTNRYNILSGYFVVENKTADNITYNFRIRSSAGEGYLWPTGTGSQVKCFNKNNGENTVVAFQLTN